MISSSAAQDLPTKNIRTPTLLSGLDQGYGDAGNDAGRLSGLLPRPAPRGRGYRG